MLSALCLSSFNGQRPMYAPQNEVFGDTIVAFIGDTTYDTIYTQGTEFWFTFMYQDNWYEDYYPGQVDSSNLEIIISSQHNTIAVTTNPHTGWTRTDTIKKDSLKRITIPREQGMCQMFEGSSEYKGIVVRTSNQSSVYASNYHHASFDATNILPKLALGKNYIIQTYVGETTQTIDAVSEDNPYNYWLNGVANFFHTTDTLDTHYPYSIFNCRDTTIGSETKQICDTTFGYLIDIQEHVPAVFVVLATEDNTKVDITPSIDTYDGHQAGVTYSMTLQRGETYQTVGKTEIHSLSGTHVNADKPIAVFQGDICTNVPNVYGNCCCDHIVEQAMPVNIWGKTFVVTKAFGQEYNEIQLTALHDNTVIRIGNVIIDTIQSMGSHTYSLNMSDTAIYVQASDTVACNAYFSSGNYNSHSIGDPSMVWVTPIEQRIKKITFSTFTYEEFGSGIDNQHHYINIVTTTKSLPSLLLDGQRIDTAFKLVKDNPEYSYAQYNIEPGTHTLTNNADGFAAHVYGIGIFESYAYNVGLMLEIPHQTFAQINWDINTVCDNTTKLNINFDAIEQIDSVQIYSAHNKNIRYAKAFDFLPHNESITYEIKTPGIDTLHAISYVDGQIKHQFSLKVNSLFPSSMLHQKWNDFIGVLTNNEDGMFSNGGYDFVEYQWYEDGVMLAGETNSYLYRPLNIGSEYSALLTTADGIKSMTCPITAVAKTDISEFPTVVNTGEELRAPVLDNTEMSLFTVTGQLLSHQTITPERPTFRAPEQQGNYIVRFTSIDGIHRTYKIIVIARH